MKFINIGSGSSGNSTLVVAGETCVLIDAGFSAKETVRRLQEVGQDPTKLTGIIVTHEHSDHVGGLSVLARQLKLTVHISPTTSSACKLNQKERDTIQWGENLSSSNPIEIGNLKVCPVTVPHDAQDPFIFTLESNGIKIGIVTDLGYIPTSVAEHLRGCNALFLEANHDLDMLKTGPYKWELKQRIASRLGHLSNNEMGRFLAEDFDGQAEHIVLAHLSETNNHPEIAKLVALQSLEKNSRISSNWEDRISIAHPKKPTNWIEL